MINGRSFSIEVHLRSESNSPSVGTPLQFARSNAD
jgi:hypothetical protein